MDTKIGKILEDKGARIVAVAPGATVCEAVALMNERRIGSVMVMEGERTLGIFTERDVLTRVVATQRDPAETPVQEVMTTSVIAVEPSITIREAMMIMTDRRLRHLPITVEGRIVGMISIGDLSRWVVRDQQRLIDDLNDYIHRAS